VVPAALQFLLHFNSDQFNTQLRAREYYSFVTLTTLGVGAVFQVPIAILALTRLRIVTVAQLRKSRRYAYVGCAALAAVLPGVDPVSMLLETVPLIALYELSIVLAGALSTTPDPIPETKGATR
jgi:sec-independent protein translocase protein TatC